MNEKFKNFKNYNEIERYKEIQDYKYLGLKKDRKKLREKSQINDLHSKNETYSKGESSYSTLNNQKSMWGSKTYRTKNYSRLSSSNYSEIRYHINKDKKTSQKIKKRNTILKYLIEFNQSRREVKEKYFDIWYDKTYDYNYITQKIDEKFNNYDKKYKKNKECILSKNKGNERTLNNDSDYYDEYKENEFINYRNIYNKLNKDIIDNMNRSKNKNKRKDKGKVYYYNYSFNKELSKSKEKKLLFKQKKSKEKRNKLLNKKILFILNKYMIERKEKSQCFNKWLNSISSVNDYSSEEIFNDFDNKNQLYQYNYEKTPEQNDISENNKINIYRIYNENKSNKSSINKFNEYFKINNNKFENKENTITKQIYYKEKEKKNNQYIKKIKDNNLGIRHKKEKEQSYQIKKINSENEQNKKINEKSLKNMRNKNLILGNENFNPLYEKEKKYYNNIDLYNFNMHNYRKKKKKENKKIILIKLIKRFTNYNIMNSFYKWFNFTFNINLNKDLMNDNFNPLYKLNNNENKSEDRINKYKKYDDFKNFNKEIKKNKDYSINKPNENEQYLYIGKRYIKSKNKNENEEKNIKKEKNYFKKEFKIQLYSDNDNKNKIIENNNLGNNYNITNYCKNEFNTIENIKEKITEENKIIKDNIRKNTSNIENLSKNEKKIYKKFKRAIHLLRKAIRSIKKRKKNEYNKYYLNDFFKIMKKNYDKIKKNENNKLNEINREVNKDNYLNVASALLKIKKLKKIFYLIDNKLRSNYKIKYFNKWYKIICFDNNNYILSKKKIESRNKNQIKKNNTSKVFYKKNILSRKKSLNINSEINRGNLENKETNFIKLNKIKFHDLNKKIKFSINNKEEKNQIIVFNNFNIKDINGRKEIIINRAILPPNNANQKQIQNNYTEPLINVIKEIKINNDSYKNNEELDINRDYYFIRNYEEEYSEQNFKENKKDIKVFSPNLNIKEKNKLIKLINSINLNLIKEKYFIPWMKKSLIKNKTKKTIRKRDDKKKLKKNKKYESKEIHSISENEQNDDKILYNQNKNYKKAIIENELKNKNNKKILINNNKIVKLDKKPKNFEEFNNKNVTREFRSNSRKIIIRHEPLDSVEEEKKRINKSYSTNEIKFNSFEFISKNINEDIIPKQNVGKKINKNNLKIENKYLKKGNYIQKNDKIPKENEFNNSENEEDESSALLEDPSEINTIYTINNNQKENYLSDSKSIKNSGFNNIIQKEDKNINKINEQNIKKNKKLLPYIYKLSFYNNNAINKTLEVLKNCSEKLFNVISSENYVKILEKNQKIISAYQIYCLYSLFNNGTKFYELKYGLNKWKKYINSFHNKSKKIKSNNSHFHFCNLYYIKNNKRISNELNAYCCCTILKQKIKNIIKNKFMKDINPKRYYLLLWLKKILSRAK